jgi:hypothetical protein
MDDVTDSLIDEALPRARLALRLEHFSRLDDERESWRVMSPLSEVLLLRTCATLASCDDFDEIAAGAGTTSNVSGGSRRFLSASRASGGGARWSTVSIRSCSGAASRTGSGRSGPVAMT